MYGLDVTRGLSGDMLLAALIDLELVDRRTVRERLRAGAAALGIEPPRVERTRRMEFLGTRVAYDKPSPPGMEGSKMRELLKGLGQPLGLKSGMAVAEGTLDRLIAVEAQLHGVPKEAVKLAEIGRPETLLTLGGIGLLVQEIGADQDEVLGTPVTVGFGTVAFSHGRYPIPTPATAKLLEGLLTQPGPKEGELATPTGAALYRTLVKRQVGELPENPSVIGVGFGSRIFRGFVGCSRVLVY